MRIESCEDNKTVIILDSLSKEAHICLTSFYSGILTALGRKGKADCCHIEVSRDIQDEIFEYYKEQGNEEYQVGMMWCFSGPKVNEKLDMCTIVLDDKFVVEEEV